MGSVYKRLVTLALSSSLLIQARHVPRPGEKAPYLRLGTVLQGRLDPQGTHKGMLIEFWATWCAGCRENIPHLNRLSQLFRNSIDFISLSNEKPEVVLRFLAEQPLRGIVAIDTDGTMSSLYGIRGIPQAVLIDTNGILAAITDPSKITADTLSALTGDRPPASAPRLTPVRNAAILTPPYFGAHRF